MNYEPMAFEILFSKNAANELKKLPFVVQERIWP